MPRPLPQGDPRGGERNAEIHLAEPLARAGHLDRGAQGADHLLHCEERRALFQPLQVENV